MIIKEQVGLYCPLDRKLANKMAVLKAYFDGEPARTSVEAITDSDSGTVGKTLLSSAVSDNVMWHLAEHIKLSFSLVDQSKTANA